MKILHDLFHSLLAVSIISRSAFWSLYLFDLVFPAKAEPHIEAPRSKLRGIFDRKEVYHSQIRSLTPQQAAGNALAIAVQDIY